MGHLKRVCSTCGAENDYTDKFCLKCGRKLPESPIDYYSNISNSDKKNTTDSTPSFYDNLKKESPNKNKISENKNKPKVQKNKPEGFNAWWKSKDFITKWLLVLAGIFIFFIVLCVIASQEGSPISNDTKIEDNSSVIAEEDTPVDTQEQEKADKISDIENSEVFKRSIDQFVSEGFDPEDEATIKNLRIVDLISDNKIVVSFDVDWIDINGNTETTNYNDLIFLKKGANWISELN